MKVDQFVKSSVLAAAVLFATAAFAGELKPFDPAAFQKAQSEGKTVVLDFHADWCPTCQKQQPILRELVGEKEFDAVVAFAVNYDEAAELKRNHNVAKQSTLIVFKGKSEAARDMALTDKDGIKALIRKGL